MQVGNVTGADRVRGRGSPLVQRVVDTLVSNGYTIADYTDTRGCVDIIAKRGDRVLVIRVLSNVDALREDSVAEFSRVATAVGGIPLIVGERTKHGPIEDGAVYRRYGVAVISLNTFESFVRGEDIFVEEYRGKRVVYIDPERLRALRVEAGLSQRELALAAGVTKDSIYRYERGYPAQEEVVDRIEEVLGGKVRKGVEISPPERETGLFRFRAAPWRLYVSHKLSVAMSPAKGTISRKVELLLRGIGVSHDLAALVGEKEGRVGDVPVLPEDEMRELKRPKDIVKRVREGYEQ